MDARVQGLPTVIVVDDDEGLLQALRFSLELEGFKVIAHRTSATVRPEDLPPFNACLVIDLILPGASGLDLLGRLRESGVRLPAIVITTRVDEDLRRACARLGASAIEKPLLGPDLTVAIRAALGVNDQIGNPR